jgi:hypothetical protein
VIDLGVFRALTCAEADSRVIASQASRNWATGCGRSRANGRLPTSALASAIWAQNDAGVRQNAQGITHIIRVPATRAGCVCRINMRSTRISPCSSFVHRTSRPACTLDEILNLAQWRARRDQVLLTRFSTTFLDRLQHPHAPKLAHISACSLLIRLLFSVSVTCPSAVVTICFFGQSLQTSMFVLGNQSSRKTKMR